jgi:hypothetical protein
VTAWVSIDADCPITCVAADGIAELSFGGPLELSVSEGGLAALIATASQALHTLRGHPTTVGPTDGDRP